MSVLPSETLYAYTAGVAREINCGNTSILETKLGRS